MINTENYESYLFLYQEGELNSTERKEVEVFLAKHPDIREEMETYYDPTLVVTAEPPAHKSTRITSLWRWAAAACVVLALGYGVYLTLQQPTDNGTLTAETSPITPHIDTTTPDTKETPTIPTPVQKSTLSHSIPSSEPVPTISPLPALIERDIAYMLPVEVLPFSNPNPVPGLSTNTVPELPINTVPVQSTILVDNLARVIPDSNAERTPPVFNLATRIKQSIDIKQQELVDFVHNVFHTNDNQELAEAN